jgi:hypothetical protein
VDHRRRSLMQFDVSGIPAGATIQKAQLWMHIPVAPTTDGWLTLHHIFESWTETGVTWNTLPEYSSALDADQWSGTTAGWKSWYVQQVVQAWCAGTYANHGMLVRCGQEGDPGAAFTFDTREIAAPAFRPYLAIEYTTAAMFECSYVGSGSCGWAPPPMNNTGANAARFTKGSGDILNVTYDAGTCGAEKVIILHGNIGAWTGYAGCAQADGGNTGSTTVDSAGQNNVWYNLVWTQGTTAGHPGYAFDGTADLPRTWPAGALCGMVADDPSHATCP